MHDQPEVGQDQQFSGPGVSFARFPSELALISQAKQGRLANLPQVDEEGIVGTITDCRSAFKHRLRLLHHHGKLGLCVLRMIRMPNLPPWTRDTHNLGCLPVPNQSLQLWIPIRGEVHHRSTDVDLNVTDPGMDPGSMDAQLGASLARPFGSCPATMVAS